MLSNHAVSKKFGLDATAIKYLLAVLMFFDHVMEMFPFYTFPAWIDILARCVLPTYLFLSAESFHYTHSKTGYIKRLLIASWCMTLLDFVVPKLYPNAEVVLINNAFATFFVSALCMYGWDHLRQGYREKNRKQIGKGIFFWALPFLLMIPFLLGVFFAAAEIGPEDLGYWMLVLSMFFPHPFSVEGGAFAVLAALLMYLFREKRPVQMIVVLALAAGLCFLGGGFASSNRWAIALTIIPMFLYNGKRGRGDKYFFYIFYPTHIIGLYLIGTMILNSMG